eukprot:TRINITY_DN4297_c0_g1_i3.p2 TRINITY_DN4297_c0_g1~~TRINITY_DN4297_c0_g1_i3.p2  ORF type:complete len:315 (+),score=28.19 TRINITY_DN4297_c0_g1_i3:107-1051(+)
MGADLLFITMLLFLQTPDVSYASIVDTVIYISQLHGPGFTEFADLADNVVVADFRTRKISTELCANTERRANDVRCSGWFAPVCTAMQQTFSNCCKAKLAGVDFVFAGACPPKNFKQGIRLDDELKEHIASDSFNSRDKPLPVFPPMKLTDYKHQNINNNDDDDDENTFISVQDFSPSTDNGVNIQLEQKSREQKQIYFPPSLPTLSASPNAFGYDTKRSYKSTIADFVDAFKLPECAVYSDGGNLGAGMVNLGRGKVDLGRGMGNLVGRICNFTSTILAHTSIIQTMSHLPYVHFHMKDDNVDFVVADHINSL